MYRQRTYHTRKIPTLKTQDVQKIDEIWRKIQQVLKYDEDISFEYVNKSLIHINYLKRLTSKQNEIKKCEKLISFLEQMRRVIFHDLVTDEIIRNSSESESQNINNVKSSESSYYSEDLLNNFENISLNKDTTDQQFKLNDKYENLSTTKINPNMETNLTNTENSLITESEIVEKEIDSSQETYCSVVETELLKSETETINKNSEIIDQKLKDVRKETNINSNNVNKNTDNLVLLQIVNNVDKILPYKTKSNDENTEMFTSNNTERIEQKQNSEEMYDTSILESLFDSGQTKEKLDNSIVNVVQYKKIEESKVIDSTGKNHLELEEPKVTTGAVKKDTNSLKNLPNNNKNNENKIDEIRIKMTTNSKNKKIEQIQNSKETTNTNILDSIPLKNQELVNQETIKSNGTVKKDIKNSLKKLPNNNKNNKNKIRIKMITDNNNEKIEQIQNSKETIDTNTLDSISLNKQELTNQETIKSTGTVQKDNNWNNQFMSFLNSSYSVKNIPNDEIEMISNNNNEKMEPTKHSEETDDTSIIETLYESDKIENKFDNLNDEANISAITKKSAHQIINSSENFSNASSCNYKRESETGKSMASIQTVKNINKSDKIIPNPNTLLNVKKYSEIKDINKTSSINTKKNSHSEIKIVAEPEEKLSNVINMKNKPNLSTPTKYLKSNRNKKEKNICTKQFNFSPDESSSYSEQFLHNSKFNKTMDFSSDINDLSEIIPVNTNYFCEMTDEYTDIFEKNTEHELEKNKTNIKDKFKITPCNKPVNKSTEDSDPSENYFADISVQNSEISMNTDSENYTFFDNTKEIYINKNKTSNFHYNTQLSLLDNIENYKTVIVKKLQNSPNTFNQRKNKTTLSESQTNEFKSVFQSADKSTLFKSMKQTQRKLNKDQVIQKFLDQNNFGAVKENDEIEKVTSTVCSMDIKNTLYNYRTKISKNSFAKL